MIYSKEPRFEKNVKGYGFLSFVRKFGDKYSKILMETAAKTASKRVVQKTTEASGDLSGSKIADKITSVPKLKNKKQKTDKAEEIYIPPEKRQQFMDDFKLF